jgi:alpha-L-fucosidase 2
MQLQSHAGEIELLPALPQAWSDGSFRGLRARGGALLDLEWRNGRATRGALRATSDGRLSLRAPRGQELLTVTSGARRLQLVRREGAAEFAVAAGSAYELSFRDALGR